MDSDTLQEPADKPECPLSAFFKCEKKQSVNKCPSCGAAKPIPVAEVECEEKKEPEIEDPCKEEPPKEEPPEEEPPKEEIGNLYTAPG